MVPSTIFFLLKGLHFFLKFTSNSPKNDHWWSFPYSGPLHKLANWLTDNKTLTLIDVKCNFQSLFRSWFVKPSNYASGLVILYHREQTLNANIPLASTELDVASCRCSLNSNYKPKLSVNVRKGPGTLLVMLYKDITKIWDTWNWVLTFSVLCKGSCTLVWKASQILWQLA